MHGKGVDGPVEALQGQRANRFRPGETIDRRMHLAVHQYLPALRLAAEDPATRLFLRHALATLAYRAGKAVRGAPDAFGDYRPGPESRSPREILAHMGDLLDWLSTQLRGAPAFQVSEPLPWPDEIRRFYRALEQVDAQLASEEPIEYDPGRFFQGGLADALVLFGAKQGERVLSAGYTVNWTAGASSTDLHLLDLDPTKKWSVRVNGGAVVPLTVSSAGVGQLAGLGAAPASTIGVP